MQRAEYPIARMTLLAYYPDTDTLDVDLRRDRTSFQTGELGPRSPHMSDEAVQVFNRMIDEIETISAAA